MGLDDQVTCYRSTSARAVNQGDVSDRSMEPELRRANAKERESEVAFFSLSLLLAHLLGSTGLKAAPGCSSLYKFKMSARKENLKKKAILVISSLN